MSIPEFNIDTPETIRQTQIELRRWARRQSQEVKGWVAILIVNLGIYIECQESEAMRSVLAFNVLKLEQALQQQKAA